MTYFNIKAKKFQQLYNKRHQRYKKKNVLRQSFIVCIKNAEQRKNSASI